MSQSISNVATWNSSRSSTKYTCIKIKTNVSMLLICSCCMFQNTPSSSNCSWLDTHPFPAFVYGRSRVCLVTVETWQGPKQLEPYDKAKDKKHIKNHVKSSFNLPICFQLFIALRWSHIFTTMICFDQWFLSCFCCY